MRGSRPGKTVQMSEAEVRGLCLKSRELFLQQPILLELEAPLKICGKLYYCFPDNWKFFNFMFEKVSVAEPRLRQRLRLIWVDSD